MSCTGLLIRINVHEQNGPAQLDVYTNFWVDQVIDRHVFQP